MASIRHRVKADGTASWQVLYRHEGRQRSDTFATDRGAREFQRLVDDLGAGEALAILAEREDQTTAVPRLRDWCTTYIDGLTGVQDGTRARYRLHVDRHLGSLAALPVTAVTPQAVARWVNAMDRQGLSGKSIANRHGFLSGALKSAVRRKVIDSNPCDGTRIPKTERQEMVFLTDSEFAILLSHVPVRGHDIVACLPSTGLRLGEITALQVRDLDVEAGTLTVSRAWKDTGAGNGTVLGATKTTMSRRTIALPRQALRIMEEHAKGRAPEDYLFTNSAGRPWTRSRFHEGIWQPAVRAARAQEEGGLRKRPRVHDMRHTCAAWMIRAGLPLPVIQRHLGHESIKTTIDRYGHLEPAHLAMAATALSAALSSALPEIEA